MANYEKPTPRGKYRCAVGGEFLSIQDFPESQNRLMQNRMKTTIIDPGNCGMTCRKHMGIPEAVYSCNGPCSRTLPASKFSASTRKGGMYICKECLNWRVHTDAEAPIPEPGQKKNILEEEKSLWDHPILSERMMDIQIANYNQTTMSNPITLFSPLPGEPDHTFDDNMAKNDLVTKQAIESKLLSLPCRPVVPFNKDVLTFSWHPPAWMGKGEDEKWEEKKKRAEEERRVFGWEEMEREVEEEYGEGETLDMYMEKIGIYEKLKDM